MKEIVCYTVEEAAAILKLGKSTVYSLLHEGKLKAVKIGRKWRITEDEINRILSGADIEA